MSDDLRGIKLALERLADCFEAMELRELERTRKMDDHHDRVKADNDARRAKHDDEPSMAELAKQRMSSAAKSALTNSAPDDEPIDVDGIVTIEQARAYIEQHRKRLAEEELR